MNNSTMNLVEMFYDFLGFTKRKIRLFLLLFIVIGGLALTWYVVSKPYYRYTLTLSSKALTKGDINVILGKMVSRVKESDPRVWSPGFAQESSQAIKSINLVKMYGTQDLNTSLEVDLYQFESAENVQTEILNYINASPEVIQLNEQNTLQKSQAKPYTVLSGFDLGTPNIEGPKISKYIEWSVFSFLAIWMFVYGIDLYVKRK